MVERDIKSLLGVATADLGSILGTISASFGGVVAGEAGATVGGHVGGAAGGAATCAHTTYKSPAAAHAGGHAKGSLAAGATGTVDVTMTETPLSKSTPAGYPGAAGSSLADVSSSSAAPSKSHSCSHGADFSGSVPAGYPGASGSGSLVDGITATGVTTAPQPTGYGTGILTASAATTCTGNSSGCIPSASAIPATGGATTMVYGIHAVVGSAVLKVFGGMLLL